MNDTPEVLRPPRGVPRAAWVRLTRFQQQVYRAVSRIPKGKTRSYQWVAQRIDRPRAARAVGNALHRNPFTPRIPCHRVIRADGSLGGFSRGPAKKRRLLLAEHRPDRPHGKNRFLSEPTFVAVSSVRYTS